MSPGIFFQKEKLLAYLFLFQSISCPISFYPANSALSCPIPSAPCRPPRIVMKPKEVTNLLGERRRRGPALGGDLCWRKFMTKSSQFSDGLFSISFCYYSIYSTYINTYISLCTTLYLFLYHHFFSSQETSIYYIYIYCNLQAICIT